MVIQRSQKALCAIKRPLSGLQNFLQQFCDLHADTGVGLELCIFYSWTWMPFNWDKLHDFYKSEYGSFDQH